MFTEQLCTFLTILKSAGVTHQSKEGFEATGQALPTLAVLASNHPLEQGRAQSSAHTIGHYVPNTALLLQHKWT